MILHQHRDRSLLATPLDRQASHAALGSLPPGPAAAQIGVTTQNAQLAEGRGMPWLKCLLLFSGKHLLCKIHF